MLPPVQSIAAKLALCGMVTLPELITTWSFAVGTCCGLQLPGLLQSLETALVQVMSAANRAGLNENAMPAIKALHTMNSFGFIILSRRRVGERAFMLRFDMKIRAFGILILEDKTGRNLEPEAVL